jgi:orotate phosphoribosyltransferase
MIENKDRALKVAELLLKVKAVKLQPNEPFTWASGWKSPIYCDNRVTLSHPSVRTYIRQAFCEMILEMFGKPDVIAGVATGGVPQGVLIAQELGLPFIYIRSSAKAHGMGNLIEGAFEPGQKVIVIEDLISTGGSSIKAVESLKEAGLIVDFDTLRNLDYAWQCPRLTYRGILYCLPTELNDKELKKLGLRKWI